MKRKVRQQGLMVAACLLGLFTQLAGAVEVVHLYRETVPVQSQSQQDRRAAARQALELVLVRLSGTTDVLHNGDVHQALSRADNYLAQFSYQRSNGDSESAYQVRMDFQQAPLLDLLKRSGQPLWSSNRPALFACVSWSDGATPQWITAEVATAGVATIEWTTVMLEQARRRGLPLDLPLAGAESCAAQANVMGTELVLSGDITLVGDNCVSEWSLPFDGGRQWKFAGGAAEECIGSAMDAVAETMSARYAFAATGNGAAALQLRVAGVDDFAAYTDVLLMLKELAMVSAVSVASVAGNQVDFSLETQGEVDKLQRAIRMGGLLLEQEAPVQVTPDMNAPTSPGLEVVERAPRLYYRIRR